MSLDAVFGAVPGDVRRVLERALEGRDLGVDEAVLLCGARGPSLHALVAVADHLREAQVGDQVGYVVNRNVNFTNVCAKACRFCAFSRTRRSEEGYFLPIEEIVRRALEAQSFGATEICIQAGLAPGIDARFYVDAGPRVEGGRARAARARHVARGGEVRGHRERLVLPPGARGDERRRPRLAAGHLGRGARRPRARAHRARAHHHRRVGRRGDHGPRDRPAHDVDDHVRPRRDRRGADAAPRSPALDPAADGRLHRVRAALVRARRGADDAAAAAARAAPRVPRGTTSSASTPSRA